MLLENLLKEIGLNNKETLLINALIELGKATAQTLARKTELPRTTIYGIINRLVEEGIVTCNIGGRSSTYTIPDPRVFTRYLEREQEKLIKKKELSKELEIHLTTHLTPNKFHGPRVVSAEGKKDVEKILFEYGPKWRESYKRVKDCTLYGYQDHGFVEQYKRWHTNQAWTDRPEEYQIKLFSDQAGVDYQNKNQIPKRFIRLLPTGITFSSTIWVHGEYLFLGVTNESHHRATIIHDPIITNNYRSLFQWLWKVTSVN